LTAAEVAEAADLVPAKLPIDNSVPVDRDAAASVLTAAFIPE